MDENHTLDFKKIALFCRILGVHILASLDELKQARNRLAKIYHPDKTRSGDKQITENLQEKFQKIQEAYEFLKQHNQQILYEFSHMNDFSLISSSMNKFKAHCIYKTVEQIA